MPTIPSSAGNPTGSICLVTNEMHPLFRNGGIGTYYWLVARLLVRSGWKVHVLYAPLHTLENLAMLSCRQELASLGIEITFLQELSPVDESAQQDQPHWWAAHHSERVRAALMHLNARHVFDLIEFPEYTALGFRTVQAKRTGQGFVHTKLIVKLHSSHQWCREAGREPIPFLHEMVTNHCERYAFDHADVQQSPCQYMLDYAASIGWNVRDEARVVANPFEPATRRLPASHAGEIQELVFFGRLEARKGLELFLGAVRELPRSLGITFLGRSVPLENGQTSAEFIRQSLSDRDVTILSDLDRQGAIHYLMSGPRLAVVPSLLENFPNTVIECLTHGIPFVASAVGGIPEIVTDPELQSVVLAQPTIVDLRRVLSQYLSAAPADRVRWQQRVATQTDIVEHDQQIAAAYSALMIAGPTEPKPVATPKVTLAVWVRPGERQLEACLQSLSAQTYPNLEIRLLTDRPMASYSDSRAQTLIVDTTSSACAWNAALEQAAGEIFIGMESDQLARPTMVESLVRGLETSSVAALSCYSHECDADEPERVRIIQPIGQAQVYGGLENVFGSRILAIRTRTLRAIGGFADDSRNSLWITCLRLLRDAHAVDVLPETLITVRTQRKSKLSSRFDSGYAKHLAILRECRQVAIPHGPEAENLWLALGSAYYRENELILLRHELQQLKQRSSHLEHHFRHAESRLSWFRYQVVDWLHRQVRRVPGILPLLKYLIRGLSRPYQRVKTRAMALLSLSRFVSRQG